MSCLGVHFALTEKEAATFRGLVDEQARLSYLQEVIEELYFGQQPDLKAESDKSWDAMHRSLADGQLSWDGGAYPLNHAVCTCPGKTDGSIRSVSVVSIS